MTVISGPFEGKAHLPRVFSAASLLPTAVLDFVVARLETVNRGISFPVLHAPQTATRGRGGERQKTIRKNVSD
jgi:hypothetical protein